jgi:hypothetical protein
MRKDGGSFGRVRGAALPCAIGVAGLLGLAACGTDDTAWNPDDPQGCPSVRIVSDADRITQFRDGPGRDLTDVVARGVIADFSGECAYEGNTVTVDLDLVIGAEKGPAAAAGDPARFVYFVAVADPELNILNKREFDTEIAFEGASSRAAVMEELVQVIPLERPVDGQYYQVLVGFQVSPEQLDYNRR